MKAKTKTFNFFYEEIWIMLLGIPIISFLIPIVFFGIRFNSNPKYNIDIFWVTLIYTTIIWSGNLIIINKVRNRYPLFADVKKKLIIEFISMFIFTIICTNVLGYIDYIIEGDYPYAHNFSRSNQIISSNNASVFCLIMIATFHELKFFMNELKHSVEEREMLKRESLQAQLNALKTQVNPHFLFNNLNTLCSIIPENPKQAVDFVQQLSKVYRHILEVKDEKSISLKDEMEVLKAYAFLLKTRFGDNLIIDINVAEKCLSKYVVPLSLQLLMENAIKHNIVSHQKPLTIKVLIQNDHLIISNNLQKKNQIIESTGMGLNNIRNRYKLLTEKPINVKESETDFIVSIPLLAN